MFQVIAAIALVCAVSSSASAENPPGPLMDNAVGPRVITLENAMRIALSGNRDIIAAGLSAQGGRLAYELAESEFDYKLYPEAVVGATRTGSASGSVYGGGLALKKQMTTGGLLSAGPRITHSDNGYTSALTVSLEQPLFRGFGREYALDRKFSAAASLASLEKSHTRTLTGSVLSVVTTFYEAVRQKETASLYSLMAERMRFHAEAASAKEKVGIATAIDVYRAQIQLKNAEDSLAMAQDARQSALDNLKSTLSLPLTEEIEPVSGPLSREPVTMNEERAMEIAFSNRVETKQAEEDIREEERGLNVALNGLLPQASLALDMTKSGASDDLARSAALDQSIVFARLTTTGDFSRSAEKHAYLQKKLNVEKARMGLLRARDDVTREVRSAMRDQKRANERATIIQEQIGQAEGKLQLAQLKFTHGMAGNFDVIEAEVELARARGSLASASIDSAVNVYRLRAALGTLLD